MSEPVDSDRLHQARRLRSIGVVMLSALCLGLASWFYVAWYPFSKGGLIILACLPIGLAIRTLPGFRNWFSPLEMSIVFVLMATIATMLFHSMYCGTGRLTQCRNNLKQIEIALHNYHEAYGSFPPRYVADSTGRPIHSWRVLLLPFLDHTELYERYSFDEPWDGPQNRPLLAEIPSVYRCPEEGEGTATSYVAVSGDDTMWPKGDVVTFGELQQTDETVHVVETAGLQIDWTEPRDLNRQSMSLTLNGEEPGPSSLHREITWGEPPIGAWAAMVDGSLRLLTDEVAENEMRELLTRKPKSVAVRETASDQSKRTGE